MKLDLTLNLKLDAAERKNEFLKANHLAVTGVQPQTKRHKRKGGRKKAKFPSLIQKVLQATKWIPPDVLATFLTVLFGSAYKVFSK